MQNGVEDIHRGILELRSMLGPIDSKLGLLEYKVTAKASELEARIATHSLRITEQAAKCHEHSEQIAILVEEVKWIEAYLNLPKRPDKKPGAGE